MPRRLAVVGHPVAHSLSPLLHQAANRALGLDWDYGRSDVTEGSLGEFVAGLDRSWRGLSATMPLKEGLLRLADDADRTARLVGAANTMLFTDDGKRSARNTDVAGAERALYDAGLRDPRHAVVVGAGATARSVLVALDRSGLRAVTVVVRDPARAGVMRALADELGIEFDLVGLDDLARVLDGADVVAWTLPNGVPLPARIPADTVGSAVALDVTYHPWPGVLAEAWLAHGGRVASGRDLLLHQAVRQVRFFVSGQTDEPLDDEALVESAMRTALDSA